MKRKIAACVVTVLFLSFAPVAFAVVGTLAGTANVSDAGSAQYSIPIEVPPGINGVEPTLTLGYDSSNSGNGIVGVGFALSGLPSIQRCAASKAIEGANWGIDFSAARFCWQGQRLLSALPDPVVTESDPDHGGTHTYYGDYRTEVETLVRVRAYRDAANVSQPAAEPSFFKVWTADGRIFTFGKTADARLTQAPGTLIWALNRVEDRHGNYMMVSYLDVDVTGEQYPLRIEYTGNGNLAPARVVEFDYGTADRTDVVVRYVNGFTYQSRKLLQKIKTRFNGTLVNEYVFSYLAEPSGSLRSRIQSVQRCDGSGTITGGGGAMGGGGAVTGGFLTCLNPTQVSWRNAGSTRLTYSATPSHVSLPGYDFNGDGLVDNVSKLRTLSGTGEFITIKVSLRNRDGKTFKTEVVSKTPQFAATWSGDERIGELVDVNGDGILDFFRADANGLDFFFGLEEGGVDTVNRLHYGPTAADGSSLIYYDSAMTFRYANQLADLNGDGLLDVFMANPQTPNQYSIRLAQKNTAGQYCLTSCGKPDVVRTFTGWGPYETSWGFRQSNQLADVNGDGVLDLFSVDAKLGVGVTVRLGRASYQANGSPEMTFSAGVKTTSAVTPYPTELKRGSRMGNSPYPPLVYGNYFSFMNQLVDINGDGNLDIVRAVPAAGEDVYSRQIIRVWQWDNSRTKQICKWDEDHQVRVPRHSDVAYVHLGLGDGKFSSAVASPTVLRSRTVAGLGSYTDTDRQQNGSPPTFGYDEIGSTITINGCTRTTYVYYETNPTLDVQGIADGQHILDFDLDGIADIISIEEKIYVAFGKGNGTFAARVEVAGNKPALIPGQSFFKNQQFLDFDNDGDVDLFGGYSSYLNQHQPLHLAASITNGVGLVSRFTYVPFTGSTADLGDDYLVNNTATPLASKAFLASTPHVHTLPRRFVVEKTEETDPGSTFSLVSSYGYGGSVVDMMRGWMGFGRVVRTAANGLKSDTQYRLDFPFVGRPLVSGVKTSAGNPVTNKTYVWGQKTFTQSPVVGLLRTEEIRYNPLVNGVAFQVTTETYADSDNDGFPYDQNGNAERHESTTLNSNDKRVTENRYEYNPSKLTRGFITARHVKQTDTAPGNGSDKTEVRTQAALYNNTTGRLVTEITQSNFPIAVAADALSTTTHYTYTNFGEVKSVTLEGRDPTYDSNGVINSAADVKTRVETLFYSGHNTYPASAGTGLLVTKFVGPQEIVSESTVVSSPTQKQQTTINTLWGKESQVVAPDGVVSQATYDSFGRVATRTRYVGASALQNSATTSYLACDASGRMACSYQVQVKQDGVTPVLTQYDALARGIRGVSRHTDGVVNVYQDTDYDSAGRLSRSSLPYFANGAAVWVSRTYDAASRVYTETKPNGSVQTNLYDGFTTTSTVSGPNFPTRSTRSSQNARGQIAMIQDAHGSITNYEYAPFNLLSRVVDAKGNVISATYDIYGRPTTNTDPDMGTVQIRYNAFGEEKWRKDANSHRREKTYDALGRVTVQTAINGQTGTSHPFSYVYDNAAANKAYGRIDFVTGPDGYKEDYEYDAGRRQNKVNTTVGGSIFTLGQSHDGLNRPISVTYPNSGLVVNYSYYSNGFLEKVHESTGTTVFWRGNAYSEEGQLKQISWGNGLMTTQDYDANMRAVTSIKTTGVQDLSYAYFANGNLMSQTNNLSGVIETFSYDLLDRLKAVQTTASGVAAQYFDFDAVGNIVYKSGVGYYKYESTRPHAVTSIAGTGNLPGDANNDGVINTSDISPLVAHLLGGTTATGRPDCNMDGVVNVLDVLCVNLRAGNATAANDAFTYDANGNLTSGGGRTISYTAFNMPQQITANGATVSYGYDHNLARITQTAVKNGVTTLTTYVGKLYEQHKTNNVVDKQTFYIVAAGAAVAARIIEGNLSKTYYLHGDRMGSVVAVTDAAKTVVEKHGFDAYGLARAADWASNAVTPFALATRGFTGHEHDVDTGLINMNARLYDPRLGRFMTPDPVTPDLTNPQALNRYSYVLNNPLRYDDPTGKDSHNLVTFDTGYYSPGKGEIVFTSGEYAGTTIDRLGNFKSEFIAIDNSSRFAGTNMGMNYGNGCFVTCGINGSQPQGAGENVNNNNMIPPGFDSRSDGFHHYPVKVSLCRERNTACSINTAKEIIQRYPTITPDGGIYQFDPNYGPVKTGDVSEVVGAGTFNLGSTGYKIPSLFTNGTVTHIIDGDVTINITNGDHVLHKGIVVIFPIWEGDWLNIYIVGIGDNRDPLLARTNEFFGGNFIFPEVGKYWIQDFERNYSDELNTNIRDYPNAPGLVYPIPPSLQRPFEGMPILGH